MIFSLSFDEGTHAFVLAGDTDSILQNRRLMLSLNRLNCEIRQGQLIFPLNTLDEISLISELERVFEKYSVLFNLSSEVKEKVKYSELEKISFIEFSQKAKKIRNNEFTENPDLISLFTEFQATLKNTLDRRLYPLQLLSAFHLAFANNACNFAVPGAGKTSIVYGAYSFLKSLPENHIQKVDKIFVIGPLSSFAPWENEYLACFGRKVSSFRMSGDIEQTFFEKQSHLYASEPAELTLISHAAVDRYNSDIIDFLKRNKTMLIVDEAHRIKNHEGVWGRSVTEISKYARSRVVLTGTPIPNGYQDIYNLIKFIYPFKYKEIIGFHYGNLESMTENSTFETERINRLKYNLSPYFIRIKKSDLSLPPTTENHVLVEMDDFQRKIYEYIESSFVLEFRKNSTGSLKDVLNKARLIRLRQASTNPSLLSDSISDSFSVDDDYSAVPAAFNDNNLFLQDYDILRDLKKYDELVIPNKYTKIIELIKNEIFPRKEKVIIWTIFIQNAKKLELFLRSNGIDSKLLIGEVPQSERESTVAQFNSPTNGDFKVVIANPFSVAESISLHKGCRNAIYLERDYNCSNFMQSKDRIHRVGLNTNEVTNYYYLISKRTIDTIIDNRLADKVKRMEQMINDDIPLFTRLNDGDETDLIKDLLSLYAKRI